MIRTATATLSMERDTDTALSEKLQALGTALLGASIWTLGEALTSIRRDR
jgi:hypothetical protein